MADKLVDMLWGFLAVFIVWLANELRKRTKPFLESVKRLVNLSRIVKQLEEDVAIEKNKSNSLQNISRDPIYIIDVNGEMTYCNQSWLDATGFKDEKEAHGLGYLRAVHPDVRAEVSNQRILISKTDTSWNGPARFKHLRTGEDITYICVSETFKDKNGKVAGTIGTLYL